MGESERMLERAFKLIDKYLEEDRLPETPVVEYLPPEELKWKLDLELGEDGASVEELLAFLETYLHYGVRIGHVQFVNLLFGGFDEAAFLGDVFATLSNNQMHTYEVAPVATLIELALIAKMNSCIGFDGGEGIFCSGGSNGNLLGMLCARNRAFPDVKAGGFAGGEMPALFISDQAHYSFAKAANQLGIGTDNVVRIKADELGRMKPDELELEIERSLAAGRKPFFVGATAATTTLGAFDPLHEIADVVDKHGLWLHVDASWGGPVVLSEKHRHLLAGSERAHSLTWDAHKMMGTPLICTAFLTRDKGVLFRAVSAASADTEYLFHENDESAYNLGRISLQCGRRVDALKLWLMWKQQGDAGMAARVDRFFGLAGYATAIVEEHPKLELLARPQSIAVCFRYVPEGAVDIDDFNLRLRERLRRSGKSMINYSTLRGKLALRLSICNGAISEADLDTLFDNITRTAGELAAERG